MTEVDKVMQERQRPESWMNGAAIILSDGREVPITDTMVRQSLESLAESGHDAAQDEQRAS